MASARCRIRLPSWSSIVRRRPEAVNKALTFRGKLFCFSCQQKVDKRCGASYLYIIDGTNQTRSGGRSFNGNGEPRKGQ